MHGDTWASIQGHIWASICMVIHGQAFRVIYGLVCMVIHGQAFRVIYGLRVVCMVIHASLCITIFTSLVNKRNLNHV